MCFELEPENILKAYKAKCTMETLRRQRNDVSSFEKFLHSTGLQMSNMINDLTEWSGITAELFEKYRQWLLSQGYALDTIKVRLATLKVYCRMANKAKIIDLNEIARINSIYYAFTGKNREHTRIGIKKEKPVPISEEQAIELKKQKGDKHQDLRDALLMCLLLDQGLRISELANLRVDHINRKEKIVTISKSRQGEQKKRTEQLSDDTQKSLEAYLQSVLPKDLLLCSFHRNDKQVREGMTGRAINERVRILGEKVGLIGLAPEDCRHYWETSIRQS